MGSSRTKRYTALLRTEINSAKKDEKKRRGQTSRGGTEEVS